MYDYITIYRRLNIESIFFYIVRVYFRTIFFYLQVFKERFSRFSSKFPFIHLWLDGQIHMAYIHIYIQA